MMKRLVTAALTDGSSLVCVQFGTCSKRLCWGYACECDEGYVAVGQGDKRKGELTLTCVADPCSPDDPCGVPPHPNRDV